MSKNTIVKIQDNETKIEYIGYYRMLDKILELIGKCSYENKFLLIDKYIELVKAFKKGDENNDNN